MLIRRAAIGLTLLCSLLFAGREKSARAQGPDDAAIAAIRKSAEKMATAFNAGRVDELAAAFLPTGELIDEAGTVYQGQQEIKNLLTRFFQKFPGVTLTFDIDSIRLVGPVAIEEGTRTMTTKEGRTRSQFRYVAVRTRTESGWPIVSFRDFADDGVLTPHDRLEPLAWLVGDWLNEGTDGKVTIAFHWSEDKNFLLGDFQFPAPNNTTVNADGTARSRATTRSSLRIGWDPSVGRIRSWLFDADGGFAEGNWTVVEDGIVVKSSSVNPDGKTASATMTFVPKDKDHFSILGTERIVGDERAPDFDLTVSRRPPAAGK